jgi:CheY-like chemotaxis protein
MQDIPLKEQGEDPANVKTVLIVEDDAAIGEALSAFLQDATAYQVIHVSDGFEALKVVRTLIRDMARILLKMLLDCKEMHLFTIEEHFQENPCHIPIPHLILLDYLLPGMDGLECLDRLRENKGVEQTPVIFMSATPPPNIQARTDLVFLECKFL